MAFMSGGMGMSGGGAMAGGPGGISGLLAMLGMGGGGGMGAATPWAGTPPFNPNAPGGGQQPLDWRALLMAGSQPSQGQQPQGAPMMPPLMGNPQQGAPRPYISTPSASEMRARRRGIPQNSMLGMLGR